MTDTNKRASHRNTPAIIFGCSGLHDTPILDHPSTLINLGKMYVNLGNVKSPPFHHHPSLEKLPCLIVACANLSAPLKQYTSHFTRMEPSWSKLNLKHYMNDELVKSIDAFF